MAGGWRADGKLDPETSMTKQEACERIMQVGIVPVVRACSADKALRAVEAIGEGGIPIAEITMTVPGAIDVIRGLVKTLGSQVLVGAGTVLNAATARQCIDAGAEFLVSPGLDLPTVEFAISQQKLIMAGALTPTEVLNAWNAGADFVKIFPCGQVGGPKYLKALRGPLPHVRMVPTGGVSLNTVADFILAGAAALGVGGELVDSEALKSGKPEVIAQNARRFLAAVRDARAQIANKRAAAATTA
jgi:2-dehydro-3-deoxyphosphogluconate aldolase/(4S)-4-hydroxy-2-oxoglutarate aldolase